MFLTWWTESFQVMPSAPPYLWNKSVTSLQLLCFALTLPLPSLNEASSPCPPPLSHTPSLQLQISLCLSLSLSLPPLSLSLHQAFNSKVFSVSYTSNATNQSNENIKSIRTLCWLALFLRPLPAGGASALQPLRPGPSLAAVTRPHSCPFLWQPALG